MALHDILAGDLLDNDFMDNIMNEGDDIKMEEGLDFRRKYLKPIIFKAHV